jgi:hypothetical protein
MKHIGVTIKEKLETNKIKDLHYYIFPIKSIKTRLKKDDKGEEDIKLNT